MSVFRSFVEVKLAHEHITEFVLRKHSSDSILDDLEWSLLELVLEGGELQVTGVAAVREIELVMEFRARNLDLSRINHDDMISHVHVRAIMNLRLASKNIGKSGRELTQDMLLSINDEPLSVLRMNFCRGRGFHESKIDYTNSTWLTSALSPFRKPSFVIRRWPVTSVSF